MRTAPIEQAVACFLDDACSGIVILVNTMAKAHQSFTTVLLLGSGDEIRTIVTGPMDLLQHLNNCLIGSPM